MLTGRCPNLQILHIVIESILRDDRFPITDKTILSMIKHCPRLDQLVIMTRERSLESFNLTTTNLKDFKKTLKRSLDPENYRPSGSMYSL